MTLKTISEAGSFGGVQGVYSHTSAACSCEMTFGLYLPPAAKAGPVPLLWFLAGLTCTHENAMVKTGIQSWASKAGLAVIFPDTSPRGAGVADDEDFALGQGAGFYVNATQAPWAPHFLMWDYVTEELPALVTGNFAVDAERQGITGHSMGGHGALTCALTFPDRFKSVSAFAPISNPTAGGWGRPQFTEYLGPDETAWAAHDASLLMAERGYPGQVLVDFGSEDPYVDLLRPQALGSAIAARRQAAIVRMQPGYDHSYFFVATFLPDHVAHHAQALSA